MLQTTRLSSLVVFWGFVSLLILAPLFRGSNRLVPLALVELLAIAIITVLLWQRAGSWGALPRQPALIGVLLAPWAVGLLQLTPIPLAWWLAMPGHAVYADAAAAAGVSLPAFLPMSIQPDVTWTSVLAGLPIMLALLMPFLIEPHRMVVLCRVLVVLALLQAIIGLAQVGAGALYFQTPRPDHAIGTFGNRNHYANFIAMIFPLLLYLYRVPRHGHQGESRRPRHGGMPPYLRLLLWGLAGALLILGLLASKSRMGIASGLFCALLATLLLFPQLLQSRRARLGAAGAVLGLVGAVFALGLDSFVLRFTSGDLDGGSGSRLTLLSGSWATAQAFWPWGSGLGTFDAAFARFQPPSLRGFVNYAHNDYMQLLIECGWLGVLLLLAAAYLLGRQTLELVGRSRRMRRLDSEARLKVACGVGLLAILLHSMVDFNLHIPANAITAALLAGLYLRPAAGNAKDSEGASRSAMRG